MQGVGVPVVSVQRTGMTVVYVQGTGVLVVSMQGMRMPMVCMQGMGVLVTSVQLHLQHGGDKHGCSQSTLLREWGVQEACRWCKCARNTMHVSGQGGCSQLARASRERALCVQWRWL